MIHYKDKENKIFAYKSEEQAKQYNINFNELVEITEEEVMKLTASTFTIEKLQEQKRQQRNNLLQETDKFLIDDYPINAKQKRAILVYRKSLRDFTGQENFETLTLPELPKWAELKIKNKKEK